MSRRSSAILQKHLVGPTLRSFHSSSLRLRPLNSISTLHNRFDNVDVDEFRRTAFVPEIPLLLKGQMNPSPSSYPIAAAEKWFSHMPTEGQPESNSNQALGLSKYLAQFGETILPYELNVGPKQKYAGTNTSNSQKPQPDGSNEIQALATMAEGLPAGTFRRFNAPLSLFLEACKQNPRPSYRLYIAQAQIADLPQQLQDDLPTPRLVKEAGKGDVYDANIWMGIPPTYTPLHKDPNPNIFVQLASSKIVRLFRPSIGTAIFHDVQNRIGQSSSATFRGEEMMEGPERDALDKVVWGPAVTDRFEVLVNPGDALFIPKGWWHSIRSTGTDITASVNWWFR